MRRKIKSFVGALLLCIAVAAALIPLSHVEAGSASASDFQMKGDILVKYTGTASAVSIPTSVKHIGKEAFAGHSELVKVEIPGYVESIDYNAFDGCSSLRSIAIPDTVTSIGNGAFSDCTSLTSITLGKNLKKLGNGVFSNCTSLASAKISKDNKEFYYSEGAIYSKDKKILYVMLPGYESESYKMPSAVEEIKSNAFWGCKKLKRVELGSNVEAVPDYAFMNCTSLEKVIFPYSMRSIGIKAFADCMNLGEIEIPMSVSDIHATAFDGCPKLQILAEEGSYAAEYEANREKSNVAQTEYDDILADLFAQDGAEAADGQEDGSGEAGEGTAEGGSSGTGILGQTSVVGGNAVVFIDNSRSKVLSGNTRPDTGDGTARSEIIGGQTGGSLPKYTIINNEKIAAQSYYHNTDLTGYKMPEGIKEIGDFAFARSGLTSVTIPEGVTTIGYGAFYHCDNLEDVVIPASVTEIEPAAFAETAWLEKQMTDRQQPYLIAGDGILLAYSGMESKVEIPEGVKKIGAEAFKGNTRITSVKLPESLTVIGEDAFAGCSSLVSISGGNKVERIKDRAFEGCPISTVKIPASVTEIGLKAYDMSEAKKADGTKNVVFLGKTLPKVSYEKTATRLINENYRDAVFKEAEIAIVDNSITSSDIEGSVLDYDLGGFRGFICSVEQAASGSEPGSLQIKYCSEQPEKISMGMIPEQVTVYGKPYNITVPEELVFLSGKGVPSEEEGSVRIESNSITLPSSPEITAEIAGSKEHYILSINDNRTDGEAMTAAYRRVAGTKMVSLQVYDISLYDEVREIPISRLGSQQMTITMPKPRGITAEKLQVVCMDEDGQLENVDARLVTVDGETCVQFEASRFGVYGIYN